MKRIRKFFKRLGKSEKFFEFMELSGVYFVLIALRFDFVESVILAGGLLLYKLSRDGLNELKAKRGKMMRFTGVTLGDMSKGTLRIQSLHSHYTAHPDDIEVIGIWQRDPKS